MKKHSLSDHLVTLSSCHLVILSFLVAFLFFYRVAERDLWSSHEARAAQNAQTILHDGNWGLPRLLDGMPELQKPPLYYWLVAIFAWLACGEVDAWAVRLPAVLAGVGGVLLTYVLLCRRGRPVAGFLAAGFLATAMHYTWLARTGRIDMPLTLAVSVALGGIYLALVSQRTWVLVIAYVAVAAAVLLKGPIGVVLPAVVLALHLVLEGRMPWPWQGRCLLRLARELGVWWGLPLVGALTIPWFVWVHRETGGAFFESFFWKHNVQRGFGGSAELASHPWWFYLPRLSFDFLPWTPLLLGFGWLAVRRGWYAEDPEARFGAAWLLGTLGLLSLASFKRADYLLPAYPGAALFLGCMAERWVRERAARTRLGFALFPASFALVALGWWVYVTMILPGNEPTLECRRFAAAVREHAGDRVVLFFRTESHALAHHLGRPVASLLEWENLDVWASGPETIHVVMPPEVARDWPRHLARGELEPVLRNTDLSGGRHARPLVLMRTRPIPVGTRDARTAATPEDRRRPADRDSDGARLAATPGRPPGEVVEAP